MTDSETSMLVEVAYAVPEKQLILAVRVGSDCDVRGAILASGILQQFPELELDKLTVGIFGKKTKMNQSLREKDRVEIYRPLIADPKAVRKQRAAEGKQMRKSGGKNKSS